MPPLSPTTVEDRYFARLNRKAVADIVAIWGNLVDLHGRPLRAVRDLNRKAAADEFPTLREFRWLNNEGAWAHLRDGAQGKNIIDFVQYLSAGCPRDEAAEYLEKLLDRD
jgi:hypothetical protein